MSRGRHIAPKTRSGRTRWGVLGLVLGLILAMSLPALAGGPTVSITGGGISLNVDAGGIAIGGFNAKILGDGTVKGQFQAKSVTDAGDLAVALHGVVTCVEEDNGIWEIRILITKSTGPGAPLAQVGDHGSIFVQDNPDMVDEAFHVDPGSSDCQGTGAATMEAMVHGSIKVRG